MNASLTSEEFYSDKGVRLSKMEGRLRKMGFTRNRALLADRIEKLREKIISERLLP